MDKNISKYLKQTPPDSFIKRFMGSGVSDSEVVSKTLAQFSDYVSKCFKFLANDSDNTYAITANLVSWLVGFKQNLNKFLKDLKEVSNKQYQNLKNLYKFLANIVKVLNTLRDLVVILQLMQYVSSQAGFKYKFSATELSSLSVGIDTKIGSMLISKVNQDIDLLQIFKDFLAPLSTTLNELHTILNIEKSTMLLTQSQQKTAIISFEQSMSQSTQQTIDVNTDLLSNIFLNSEPLVLDPNFPIAPQLTFTNIQSPKAYSTHLDSSLTQVINTIYG